MFIRLLFILLMSVPDIAFAVCSGSSPTWTAASCVYSEVAACISIAQSGDTINVPSGTCTWTSPITIPSEKTIKLIGAGSSATIINSTTSFVNMYADNSRLSGFRFNRISGGDSSVFVEVRGVGFRIDHNYMNNVDYLTQWASCIDADAFNSTVRPEGLVDSNYLNHCKIQVFGSTNFTKDSGFWGSDSVIGTSKAVYFEDNTIDRGNIGSVLSDSNYAGSFVLRYNNLIGGNAMAHSLQGASERGTRSWEFYGNAWSFPNTTFYNIAFLRGGTGMFYNNTVNGPKTSYVISLDNVRSFQTGCCGAVPVTTNSGMCDGTSPWDGNTQGQRGWPCRDQIGRGKDTGIDSSVIGKATSSEPAFFWINKQSTGINVPVVIDNNTENWIRANQDYYDYSASFNGSSGTGCGTLAARPSTCTAGVAYWATNQSCSDLTGMVGANPSTPISGTLYKCTATNTWAAYYTPYTYPHPLTAGSPITTIPSPPRNLMINQ